MVKTKQYRSNLLFLSNSIKNIWYFVPINLLVIRPQSQYKSSFTKLSLLTTSFLFRSTKIEAKPFTSIGLTRFSFRLEEITLSAAYSIKLWVRFKKYIFNHVWTVTLWHYSIHLDRISDINATFTWIRLWWTRFR